MDAANNLENLDSLGSQKEIDNSSMKQFFSDIGQDIIKYFPSKIFGSFGNLIMVAIYTNLLSPAQYGIYIVATAVLSFLCIIFSDWIGISGLRFFTENKSKGCIKSYFSTLLFLLVSNLIFLFIASFFAFNFITSYFKIPSFILIVVLLLMIPVAVRALLFQILRAQIQPIVYSFSVILNQVTTILISVYFVTQWHLGGLSLLLGMAFSIIVVNIIMFYMSNVHHILVFNKVKTDILKEFYKYGVPISLASIGMWILTQSNKFVLQHYSGSHYNGILGVGFNLTFSVILPLFAVITIAAIPRIFNMYQEGKNVNPVITRLTEYYFVIFSPIVLILCLFPTEITAIFSSKAYAEAQILIPFLALSIFIFGLTEYTTLQYHLVKKTYIDSFIKLASGFIGLALSIILIPKYGILAVGISTLASNFVYLILTLIIRVRDLAYVPPYKTIAKVVLAISASIFAFYALQNPYQQLFTVLLVYAVIIKLSIKSRFV